MGEYLFFASAALSVTNGVVLLCVNPARAVNRVFFSASIWIALWALCIAMAIGEGAIETATPSAALVFWLRASSAVAAYLGWFLWLMQAVVTADRPDLVRTLKSSLWWFGLATIAACTTISDEFVRPYATPVTERRGLAYTLYLAILTIGVLATISISWRRFRKLTGIRRVEMQYLVFGFAAACIGNLVCSGTGRTLDIVWLRRSGPVWVLVLHGIAVWGICYQRVFEAKHIIRSVGQRILAFFLVGIVAIAIREIVSPALSERWSLVAASVFACWFLFTIDPLLRQWMMLDARAKILETRRDIIDWARGEPGENTLLSKFGDLLRDWCQTPNTSMMVIQDEVFTDGKTILQRDWVGLALVSKDGWVTPETLLRSKAKPGSEACARFLAEHNLGALLAVPRGSPSPSLLVGLGQKESLRPYTYPDIQTLLELVELMDNILTHTRVTAHAAKIEKMETAAVMSRGLAHDLNNLVTPVATILLHMESITAAGSPESEVLAHAQQSLKVMREYIGESLLFARRLVPQLSLFDASELLPEVVNICQDRAKAKGVSLVTPPIEAIYFTADRPLIQRLLQNLVTNAIDASECEPATVEVSLAETPDAQIQFRVSDCGHGVPPELVERIFEPYFTTKDTGRQHRGLGLGLAICRKIVELHGGTIQVTPNIPRGSVFTVVLPHRNSVAAATAESAPPATHQGELALERKNSAAPA